MLIKKFNVLIICVLLLLNLLSISSSALDISATGAVLINAQNNEVIFEKNKDMRLSMASTTKIMTSLLAIESGRLHCVVTAKNDINCEGTAIGIKKGESLSLETLTYAMMLESGNDAAILTAEYLAGTEKNFSHLMNKKARKIGMTSTSFVTSSGLDDELHYTTAEDMAVLGSYAIKNPYFRKICSAHKYKAEYFAPEITAVYYNHNKLLDYYDGVFGIKTGFTRKSGRCLVSACEKNGITLVAVTLNAPDDWNDHIRMYEYGFSSLKSWKISLNIPEYINVYGSDADKIRISIEDKAFPVGDVTYKINLKKLYYAPIKKGDILGCVTAYLEGKELGKALVFSKDNAAIVDKDSKPEFSFKYKLKSIFG